MKIKVIIVLFFSILLYRCSTNKNHVQKCSLEKINFIQNSKKLEYTILMYQVIDTTVIQENENRCDTCPIISPFYTAYRIDLELSKRQEKRIKLIDKTCWLKLLENDSSDWAANLVLYYMTKKNAFIFFAGDIKMERWKEYYKQEDVKYWKDNLK